MVDMAKKEILPAIEDYIYDLAETYKAKTGVIGDAAGKYEKEKISKLSVLVDEIHDATDSLEKSLIKYKPIADITKASEYIRDDILKKMAELRIPCDEAETLTAEKYWPFPTYGELLFGVR